MSSYKFACPQCKQRLEATDEMAGQTIECPACGGSIKVPPPSESVQTPADGNRAPHDTPPTSASSGDAKGTPAAGSSPPPEPAKGPDAAPVKTPEPAKMSAGPGAPQPPARDVGPGKESVDRVILPFTPGKAVQPSPPPPPKRTAPGPQRECPDIGDPPPGKQKVKCLLCGNAAFIDGQLGKDIHSCPKCKIGELAPFEDAYSPPAEDYAAMKKSFARAKIPRLATLWGGLAGGIISGFVSCSGTGGSAALLGMAANAAGTAFIVGIICGAAGFLATRFLPKLKVSCPKCKSKDASPAGKSVLTGKRLPGRCPKCGHKW